ncbi:MAG: hypothetical protein MJB14_10770 [Spirochaetes bacterium]|nr:hypothetical protein [Spirochaetota bacterium]
MAVNPLDLQTNFLQMSNVGKQQALSKESQVLRQDHASENLSKTSEKNAEDVPETKQIAENSGKVKNDGSRKQNQEEEKNKQKKEKEKSDQQNSNLEANPSGIGQNIDLLG